MALKINLGKPLFEQQSVREMLNLCSEESNLKVSLESLVKLARFIIQVELLECGRSENDLEGLRLEQVESKKSVTQARGNLFFEWKQLPDVELASKGGFKTMDEEISASKEENTSDARHTLKPLLPVSIEFLNNLSHRLDETVADSSSNTNLNTFLKFKSSPLFVLSQGGCCGDVLCSDKTTHCVDKSKAPDKASV
jgi:hypothetical protein